jgi:protocatechuate 3,4-dioxygenase, alpha subunit
MSSTKRLGQTPSQTVGPFFAYGLTPAQYGYDWTSIMDGTIARDGVPGSHITIEGRVLDGKGDPVTDAMIEIRQADAAGRMIAEPGTNSGFTGFGRVGTGVEPGGLWRFATIKPGSIAKGEAPRLDVIVLMRGLLMHAFTRIYFEDEAAANAADPVLNMVPADRRATLVARLTAPNTYSFDIHMQGDQETVFFDY